MCIVATDRPRKASKTSIALGVALLILVYAPALSAAQTTVDPVAYAVTELNLRKGPGLNDAVIAFVPLGAEVRRAPGQETNEYAPVTYNGLTGWVVALGLVATPELVDTVETIELVSGPDPAPETSSPSLSSSDDRVTLTPLMLRGGPASDAGVLAGMPEGSIVTLTREGAENGYVTVDYGGLQGWAYADLLGEELAST